METCKELGERLMMSKRLYCLVYVGRSGPVYEMLTVSYKHDGTREYHGFEYEDEVITEIPVSSLAHSHKEVWTF